MRIGLYGMPCSGKSYLLERIDFYGILEGSKLLREYDPNFDKNPESVRDEDRKAVARIISEKDDFIMDGHYAFGDSIVFTEEDGSVYDVFLYLYVDPKIINERMHVSLKNKRYLQYDTNEWQNKEILGLRRYCHDHNKDFYVVDNPPEYNNENIDDVISFIKEIIGGYSTSRFAKNCSKDIMNRARGKNIILLDGDKTLTTEDSSNRVFGYNTHLYDGNFYTGYQTWKQYKEFKKYNIPLLRKVPVGINQGIYKEVMDKEAYILTSGSETVWQVLAQQLGLPVYYGIQMAADTKFYIVKQLQEAGYTVIAYGDSMNDYYMLKQANIGFLVTKKDGSISRSLKDQDLEGITCIR